MSIAEDLPFELAVDAAPGMVTIRLRGELDLASLPGFAEAVREAEVSGTPRVLIDALAIASTGALGWALVAVALALLTRLLQRYIPGT